MDNNKNEDYELLHFEDAFEDGRLVDDSKDVNKNFRFREAIKLVEKLGRPLTNEEMKQFEYEKTHETEKKYQKENIEENTNEYNYPKPSLTNLPKELGEKIFAQMDKAVPNLKEMNERSLKLKSKMLKERLKEEENK